MRFFSTFALASAALVSSVLADGEILNERYVQTLDKRQEFTPTTQTASGNTCADAFGAGYVVCRDSSPNQNRLCYNPGAGQTCCGNQWACPSGSFCYTNGNCCPNGLSQSACAAQLSSAAAASSSAPPKPTADVNGTSSTPPTSSYTGKPWPAKNATTVQATGTAAPSTSPVQFTGAASAISLQIGVAAIGGVVALFGALL
jgi:hypothetical protein